MKKFLSLLFLILCAAQVSFSQTNQNITNTGARETEPFIAINPANPNNLIAAWMTLSWPFRINTKASFDGGATWVNPNTLPHFSSNPVITSADVSIAFNSAGIAFIAYVDYKLTLDSGYVRVAKSTNGGVSWLPPVNAISALVQPDLPVDRPWIVVDNSASAYAGRIYLVSKSYWGAAPPHKIWLSISTNDAATFSPILRIDNPVTIGTLTNIMVAPTVGADGAFYGAYISWDTAFDLFPRVVCIKSTDGGSTFTPYTIAYPVSGSSITDTLYQGSYSISANPANANNLIFQVTDARNGDPDILAVRSNDGGVTWSNPPVRVNDDALSNGIGQEMSWGAFSPNGTFAVAWRDRRNGITNDTSDFEIFTSVSTDGGATFKPNYNLSSVQSPFINQQRGNDFLGVCMNGTDFFCNWSDNRNNIPNQEDIYVNKVPLAVLSSVQEINANEIVSVTCFPNPFTAEITFSIFSKESCEATLSVMSMDGKLIANKANFNLTKGNTQWVYNGAKLAAGNYVFELKTAEGKLTKVFTKGAK